MGLGVASTLNPKPPAGAIKGVHKECCQSTASDRVWFKSYALGSFEGYEENVNSQIPKGLKCPVFRKLFDASGGAPRTNLDSKNQNSTM